MYTWGDEMKRKLITMILMSAITCCLFAGCGRASQVQPDKTDEVKSETDEIKEGSLKSENKSEEKSEVKTRYHSLLCKFTKFYGSVL